MINEQYYDRESLLDVIYFVKALKMYMITKKEEFDHPFRVVDRVIHLFKVVAEFERYVQYHFYEGGIL
jgi:hypothetical protein